MKLLKGKQGRIAPTGTINPGPGMGFLVKNRARHSILLSPWHSGLLWYTHLLSRLPMQESTGWEWLTVPI